MTSAPATSGNSLHRHSSMQPLIIKPGDIINEDDLFSTIGTDTDIDTAYISWLQSIDIILLLGGGAPLSPTEPPIYVQRRCDAVAHIMHRINHSSKVICLSAGTAHVPQFILSHTGLPLWESTASAAYLLHHPTHPVPADNVFVETTSYDTISNAFFARTVMTDIMIQEDHIICSNDNTSPKTKCTQRVLVVTNEFHVGRSKAIFDWIFGAPSSSTSTLEFNNDHQEYEMFYLSCNNVGLTPEAIDARKAHELRGEMNVRTKLSVQYKTLHGVWKFLTKEHDFYSASKLVERAIATTTSSARSSEVDSSMQDGVLKLSYGKTPMPSALSLSLGKEKEGRTALTRMVEYRNGKIVLTLDALLVTGVVIASLMYSYVYKQ